MTFPLRPRRSALLSSTPSTANNRSGQRRGEAANRRVLLAGSLTCSSIRRIEPSQKAGGTPALWRSMQSCSEPTQWFILPDLKHTTGRLDLVTGAPSGDEGARQRGIEE